MFVFALACKTVPAPEQVEPPALVSIEIEPDHVELSTGLVAPDDIQFVATGEYEDGEIAALDTVEWSLSNRSVGTLDEFGLFTPSPDNGGISYVTARLGGVEGDGEITMTWVDQVNEEGLDPALFDSTVVTEGEFWLYPEDGVNFPRNTPSIRFMWEDMGAFAYRLRLRSDVTDLSVYTTSNSWTADVESWQQIVATNAGGSVEIELEASIAGTIIAAPPRTLSVNRLDAEGSIIYWTTTNSGLMSIPYGGEASEFLTVNQTGRCVGCHVLSSQDRIAFTYDGGNGPLGVKDVNDLSDIEASNTVYGNFKAFSPDGEWLLTTLAGSLLIYDGVTAEYLGEVPLSAAVTMPTWSPNGDQVFVVTTPGHSSDWTFSGGQLGVIDVYGDGAFSDVTAIYSPAMGNICYPEFSPDGRWVAFNESTQDCYDDSDATLMVMRASGDTPPIELAAANMDLNLTNSWPRWGPLPDDDVLWLTFSSKRAYGDVVSGQPQIWVAGFDPAKAQAGEDPSWPAFWLPGQATSDNNHIPVWAP
ncbi:MAG: hypothetical protein GY913_30075 [Proteobacteria bacterium]|nr:hypothetical protein [Pseudomonadota bacterium]MCP4921165.1 hypothetical protein [Pseudomonadota bacterium]